MGLAVNPNNSNHIVAIWQDLTTQFCEVGTSFNEGRTWRRTRLKAPAGFIGPPCTVGNHLSGLLNGGIAFGRGDTVYATFASGDFNTPNEPRGKSVLVAKSTNGGRTFSTGDVALRGGPSPDVGPDYVLPQIAVRRGGPGRADRVYVSAGSREQNPSGPGRVENVSVGVSDGGTSWSAPRVVNSNTQNGIESSQPALGPDGRLHVAYRVRGAGDRPGQFVPEGDMVVATSRNDGQTWERTVTAGVRGYVFEGPAPVTGPFSGTRSFTASTFPALTTDPRSGDLYLVYGNGGQPTQPGQAQASDHFINPDQDVYFQRSTDRGGSWSRAERINRGLAIPTERLTQTRHPSVTVAPNGRVDIVWHDRRHWYRGCPHTHEPCDEARLGDTYLRSSTNEGSSFGRERRITHRSLNNDVGYDYRFGTYWDFGPRAVSLGDNRLLVGWMDSLFGNVEDDTQDIMLAKVNMRASSRIPTTRLVRRDAPAVSLALSRTAYPGGGEAVLADTFATRPATSVVIVNERDVAGALAGGVLARANLGPVLVSPAGGLPDTVKDEVARLAPVGAFIIGGEGSLSPQVAADLAETGIPPGGIRRLAGNNAADTARLIANAADRRKANEQAQPAFNAAIVVNPASRDAVTASVLAANRRLPVLFAGRNGVPAETASALQSLNIRRTLVIGDEEALGPQVLQQVPGGQRIGGDTPIGTARAVYSESRRRGVPPNVVYAAPRSRPMDAALIGAAAGRAGGLLLLSPSGAKETGQVLREIGRHDYVDRLIMVRRGR
ncbi:MAG TPA: cell wall-binding repeat-containing protein [Solirubrobacteraceae bacterium]|nr:cell wall-binding repeat-containing protein [Solirubrobacteraceae bacterium]